MEGSLTARRIQVMLEQARIDLSTEAAAQRAIEAALTEREYSFEREVILSPKDRIDFMVGSIGIEVKISGQSRRDIHAQMHRYAAHDRVSALVLATNTAFPSLALYGHGNPKGLLVANLGKGWIG